MIVRALSRVSILCLVVFGALCFIRFDGGVQRRRLLAGVKDSSAERKEENTTKSPPSSSAIAPPVDIQTNTNSKGITVDLVPGEVPASLVGVPTKTERDDVSNIKREKPCKKGTKRSYVAWANGWKCMHDPKYNDVSEAASNKNSKNKVHAKQSTATLTTANGKATKPFPTPSQSPRQEQNGLLNALRKFVPLSQEGVCLARHRGGMNGTVVKVDSYSSGRVDASSSSELAKDAACCARCARHLKCEFWVRDSSDTSSKCWLMRDFSGFNLHANRRSSFNSAWAENVRFQII